MRGLFVKCLVFSFNLIVVRRLIIAANIGTWEGPCVCFVNAELEVLGCWDKVYLVVNLAVGGIPYCCPRQIVEVESVGKGESVALRSSQSLHPLSFVSPMPNLPTVPA